MNKTTEIVADEDELQKYRAQWSLINGSCYREEEVSNYREKELVTGE